MATRYIHPNEMTATERRRLWLESVRDVNAIRAKHATGRLRLQAEQARDDATRKLAALSEGTKWQ